MGKFNEIQDEKTQSWGSNSFTTTVKEDTVEFDSAKDKFTFKDAVEVPSLKVNGSQVSAQVQSDWNQSDNTKADYIKNKPTIPSAQVQSDWNQNDSTVVDYIKNRICYGSVVKLGETTSEVEPYSSVGQFAWTSVSISALPNVGDLVIVEDEDGNIVGQAEVASPYGGSFSIGSVQGGWSTLATEQTYTWSGSAIGQLNIGDTYTVYIKSFTVDKQIDDKFISDNIARGKKGSGESSIIFNDFTSGVASGTYSFSQGANTTASGQASHSEGGSTTASGMSSHSEGDDTVASGRASHSEGSHTTTNAFAAHSAGYYTIAAGRCQSVTGEYNIEDVYSEDNYPVWQANTDYNVGDLCKNLFYDSYITYRCKTAHNSGSTFSNTYWMSDSHSKYSEIVGNGTSDTHRSNARTLDWQGNETLAGTLTIGGASGATIKVDSGALKVSFDGGTTWLTISAS